MTLRIAVFGPECSGKSTLAAALARHFDAPRADEYVRAFWEAHQGRITAADLGAIARGQMAAEDAAAARARELVVCDTELLTNTLWDDLLFPGACPGWVRAEAEWRSRAYALYLLCDNDIPFEDDVQRTFPDAAGRAMCRRLWRAAILERGLPYVEIRGKRPQRLRSAIVAVERVLQARRIAS